MSFCLFGEIREVTPLSELSNNILGEKAQKTSKVEKIVPSFPKNRKYSDHVGNYEIQ